MTDEMTELAKALVLPVKRLDGINMLRFEAAPELLAEWKAARTGQPRKSSGR